MLKFTDLYKTGDFLENYLISVRQGIPLAVFGVPESFKRFLISATGGKVLVIERDHVSALATCKAVGEFSGRTAAYIPARHETVANVLARSKDSLFERIVAVEKARQAEVVIVTAESVLQPVSRSVNALYLKRGEETSPEKVISRLVSVGYERREKAESRATFSLRGDILDVFPIDTDDPVRIDFFGDEIERIKFFDAETGSGIEAVSEIKILPAVEFDFGGDDKGLFSTILKNEVKNATKERKARLEVISVELERAIENGDAEGLSAFSCLSEDAVSVFDVIGSDATVVINEPRRVNEIAELTRAEFDKRFDGLYKSGDAFSFAKKNLICPERFSESLKKYRLVALSTLAASFPFFDPLKILNPKVTPCANYRFDVKEFYSDALSFVRKGYKTFVYTGSGKNSELLSYDLSVRKIPFAADKVAERGVTVISAPLSDGFILSDEGVAVIGSGNLFSSLRSEKKTRLKTRAFFAAPTAGDYCVHETHGVGRVIGDKKISSTEGTKDYIAVEYAGGDVLYVPVEQMDILTKYLGGEKRPKLSRIGGKDFERIKERARESIKKMSFDLKKLYAERESEKGYAFTVDEEMFGLFRDDFEYEETPDQITAENEIRRDMESEKVMDRLICGDVGFGKTEVAFRAAFIAVSNGKQAAFLTPTTILAEQHYNTAVKRFADFGVRIACLNRFRTKREQSEIIAALKNGGIDLVIGTHRLLSSDVEFKDLGLLVLDEEQRFGVEHKEKIKLMKKNVDTVTLTATPIPRTLHLSLSGIRPISVINTPPKNRLPVQTFVTEQTDGIIKDAILRETDRGGQVFVLYNRVESIYTFAEKISSLVPSLKITVTHGRMEERVLEENVMKFYRGESDVLVSTTLIENGIDLPRANTLIVIDADALGLSTLYQLKGRVGRGESLAYAYFTFKRDKILTSAAYERLNAITEFTEMGSGIKVAMRDLEIRGAGNVLGAEQHGHMDKIGYELYAKLLKEELSGESETVPELDVRVSAFIPESYIESAGSRMDAYKEIAEIHSKAQEEELVKNLKDAYGEIPEEASCLIDIAVVKSLAAKLKVKKITVGKAATKLSFYSYKAFSDKRLRAALDIFGNVAGVSMAVEPEIRFKRNAEDNVEMLKKVREFLETAFSKR
ncbi:MAG: transcription-repair coupling factor [Clostridia bacterium]|nr:transcription-repair coupling factor [Clostridia bacterium]